MVLSILYQPSEKRSAKKVSRRKKWNKVTNWLRHIEKFEKIHTKYEKEDLERKMLRFK